MYNIIFPSFAMPKVPRGVKRAYRGPSKPSPYSDLADRYGVFKQDMEDAVKETEKVLKDFKLEQNPEWEFHDVFISSVAPRMRIVYTRKNSSDARIVIVNIHDGEVSYQQRSVSGDLTANPVSDEEMKSFFAPVLEEVEEL